MALTMRMTAVALAFGASVAALAAPPSGLSPACGKAWEAMMACRAKFAASNAPPSIKQMFDQNYAKHQADAVILWRATRGREDMEQSCKKIAANPNCDPEE